MQRHSAACPRDGNGNVLEHRCRGPWGFVVDVPRTSSGHRKQVTRGGYSTKSAAAAALNALLDAERSGVNVRAGRQTVAQYFAEWLNSKRGLRPVTIASYRQTVDLYIVPGLGSLRLEDLRGHHLNQLYIELAVRGDGTERSPATIRRLHAIISSALAAAVRQRVIVYNPAQGVELPPLRRHEAGVWTPSTAGIFLDKTRDDRLFPLFLLVAVTGMRRGEVIGLRWQDVDLDARLIRIVQSAVDVRGHIVIGEPKTKAGRRTVAVDEDTVAALRRQHHLQRRERWAAGPSWHDTGLVFTRIDGAVLRPEYVSKHFALACRRANVPVIRFHDLRHTNASLALAAGVPLKVVSERLGHSTTTITGDLYTHVVPEVAHQAAERIGGLFSLAQERAHAQRTS